VIRCNDRRDLMMGWVDIPGAELTETTPNQASFTAPQGEFTARLTTAGAGSSRFSITIGDPDDAIEGEAPAVWQGVVERWQPVGARMLIICRPARSVEEVAGMPALSSYLPGVGMPMAGGIG
jgi:hypothetical protein